MKEHPRGTTGPERGTERERERDGGWLNTRIRKEESRRNAHAVPRGH